MDKLINMRTRMLFTLIIVIASNCLPSVSQAQGGPGGDPDTKEIPFDGGLTLVLAAGAGYAIKKARDEQKRRKNVAD